MRTPVWITLVAVAGIVVAWLLLTRSPEPKLAAVPATHASATIAPPATPDEREAAAVRAQTAIPPPEPPPVETKPASAPTAVTPPPKSSEPATTGPAAGDDSEAEANDESADEPESTDDDAAAPSLDVDHAADLLADWMAKDDVAGGDDAALPPSTQALKTFDQEQADPEWSAPTAQQIEAALHQWLDALPDDVRDHVDVIHVECRLTLCQILAAENEVAAPGEQSQPPQEWLQAIETLPHQSWWSEFGFVDFSTAVNRISADGYFLYQTYLRREVKPPG
jgi:hypothetical protein